MSKLIDAMKQVNDLNKSHGVTQRGGKKYTEVFVRVEAFRQAFGTDLGVDTSIVVDDGKRVVVKATIISKEGLTVGSGLAEEIRGQGNVNKTSALENAETSAIGRALASLGLHGGSYASANEIAAVQRKEKAMKEPEKKPAAPSTNAKTPPPPQPETPTSNTVPLNNHTGKELRQVDHQEFAVSLIKMFNVYVTTERDKAGNEVEPRKRMTLLRELKEHNAESMDHLSEAMLEQIDEAYNKSLRVLGAKNGEQ
jgi:hypothetical protein